MFLIFLAFLAIFPGSIAASNATLNCSDVNVVIGSALRDASKDSLFATLAKFSELDALVVPGGLFYEVTGDLTFFVPSDDDLEDEIEYWKDILELTGEESVLENRRTCKRFFGNTSRTATSPSGIAVCLSPSMEAFTTGPMQTGVGCPRSSCSPWGCSCSRSHR
jgi:hypothetical protein